ncbi:phage minor capsid protein [Streptomyces sp. CA-250714]|uniref:phage minor capsid protein n=1 Tax=Streptomyces sp. CA-250714 TaxID=3240060 RepID=UPI003D8D281E
MPIHPGMVEDLAAGTRDLYAGAEERLLGIIARQLAAGLDAPGWAERKLAAIAQLRRASQGVVDELGKAVTLEVFDVVAEAYNTGHRAAVAELGALSDDARALVDDVTPNAQAVDRLAQEAVDVVTSTHRSILRAVVDRFRAIVAEVTATPLLGTGTRRQATQDAMRRFADEGIRAFVDKAGRRWQLTSYAEMAVRTSVARAATEAHMRTLSDAGIDLVIVSDAPRECPLCRPWEGRVLAINGPTGKRTVEHAIEDGRMVPVKVAGALDEARLAGLQHPNCRHSVSAYAPGITRTEQAVSDPSGYEAGQRQREIERHIRKYKRRAAAAVTPEAKKAAEAKVRQWQGAMRNHLTAHPDLRRLRRREQPGASNLPPKRTEATAEQVEAARLWSGDEQSAREMSDDQLAAAARSNLLDERALARVEAESDRRDREELLARTRAALADGDLAALSDEELARAYGHLSDADALRVMTEMDQRDRAASLPGVRPELVGLSDAQLAARARNADPATLALLAAEAARRDALARLFPGGHLLAELVDVSDDELAWCMQYATADELARIAAEMDRRDGVPLPAPSDTSDAVADLLANRDALAEVMAPAPGPDEWGAWASDAEPSTSDSTTHDASDTSDDEQEERRITRREARELYDEYVYAQYLAAEEDCRGYLLNKRAEMAGVDPISLFSGPARIAYARASDELKAWWAEHGRMTQAEFIEQATGIRSAAAERARQNEAEHQQRR